MAQKRFTYTGRTHAGLRRKGEITAVDREQALHQLRKAGLAVTSLDLVGYGPSIPVQSSQRKISGQSLAVIYRQLHTLYIAGIQLDHAFRVIARGADSGADRQILEGIADALSKGLSLAQSMSLYPGVFGRPHIRLVEAGELGGIMGQVLETLARLTEQTDRIHRKLWAALTYPIFVLVASLLSVVGVFEFILPPFFELVKDLKIQLPWTTRILVTIASTVHSPLFLPGLAAVIVLGYLGWRRFRRQVEVKLLIDNASLNAVLIGQVTRKVAMARCMQMLAALAAGGVTLSEALPMSGASCGNSIIARSFDEVAALIKEGVSLADAMRKKKRVFSKTLVAYVEVGELSGNLPEMLVKSAEMMSLDAYNALEVLPELLEPLFITLLGVFCCIILVSVFTPLYAALRVL